MTWQRERSIWGFREFALLRRTQQTDASRSAWLPEIHGLFGIGGELVLTCIEAAGEIALLREALAIRTGPSHKAVYLRSVRFFAEGQANHLVTFGHAVANLTIRTLAISNTFVANKSFGITPKDFGPKSTKLRAWASLNKIDLDALTVTATAASTNSPALVASLKDLKQGPFAQLVDLRNNQYHRWRGESPGVSGVDFGIDPLFHRVRCGGGIEFGEDRYTEGDNIVEEIANTAEAALLYLGHWMTTFRERWTTAYEEIFASY